MRKVSMFLIDIHLYSLFIRTRTVHVLFSLFVFRRSNKVSDEVHFSFLSETNKEITLNSDIYSSNLWTLADEIGQLRANYRLSNEGKATRQMIDQQQNRVLDQDSDGYLSSSIDQ